MTVFDLYSGTGTISQILAEVAKEVIGVEIVEEAVEAAKENAALNGITNCRFIAGDVLKVLDQVEEKTGFHCPGPAKRWNPSQGFAQDHSVWGGQTGVYLL